MAMNGIYTSPQLSNNHRSTVCQSGYCEYNPPSLFQMKCLYQCDVVTVLFQTQKFNITLQITTSNHDTWLVGSILLLNFPKFIYSRCTPYSVFLTCCHQH